MLVPGEYSYNIASFLENARLTVVCIAEDGYRANRSRKATERNTPRPGVETQDWSAGELEYLVALHAVAERVPRYAEHLCGSYLIGILTIERLLNNRFFQR